MRPHAHFFDTVDDQLPQPVQDRLHEINANSALLDAKLAAIGSKVSKTVRDRLIRQALVSPTASKRLLWLRKEADQVLKGAEPVSACRSGCSACCNIGVMLAESEARAIGKAIGIKPRHPPEGKFVQVESQADMTASMAHAEALSDEFFNVPCVFLDANSACSIYEERPMACRHQINLDVDNLLCQLVEGGAVPVPYFNMMDSKLAYVIAMGQGSKLADIRHFFPRGKQA